MQQKLKTSRGFSSSSSCSELTGELPKRKWSSTIIGTTEIPEAVGPSIKVKKPLLDLKQSPIPKKEASHIPATPQGEAESSSASVQIISTFAPMIESSKTSNSQETVVSEKKRLHSKRQFSELSDSPKTGTWTHQVAIPREIKKPNTLKELEKQYVKLRHGSQLAPLQSVAVPEILSPAGAFPAQQVRPYIPHHVPEVLTPQGNVQRAPLPPVDYQEQQEAGDVSGVMSKKNPLKESSFPMNESLVK